MARFARLVESFRQLLTSPLHDATRTQRAVRYAVDLTRHCAAQLHRDEATSMAAALTYRTIFSLVPIAVLMLLVFRAFGGFENLSNDLQRKIYSYMGLTSIVLPAESSPATRPAAPPESPDTPGSQTPGTQDSEDENTQESSLEGTAPSADVSDASSSEAADSSADSASSEARQELRSSIDKIISGLTAKVSEVNFASLGFVGLALFIWAAISLVITVEQSFNKICRCGQGRSWRLRIPIYWAVITLGPFLLFVSLYVAEQLVEKVRAIDPSGFFALIFSALTGSTALLASWLLLFVLYIFMPNAYVHRRSALIGAFVAAVLWEVSKGGFKLYVSRAVSYSAIYGSLGLAPLFLMWLYITWLIVLFGLELTYTLQTLRDHRIPQAAADSALPVDIMTPHWLISALAYVAQAFQKGNVLSLDQLATRLSLPVAGAEQITRQLEKAGLVHRAQRDGSESLGYALALPPDQIKLAAIIDLGHDRYADRAPADPAAAILKTLRDAQKSAVGDLTLAHVIDHPSEPTSKTAPSDHAA